VSGNVVLATMYGRTASRQLRPIAVSEDGLLPGGSELAATVTDWTTVLGITALTPLIAFTPFADTCRQLLLGMKVAAGSHDGGVFIVETSEDGETPALSGTEQLALRQGEHDVWESAFPLLRRYFRLSVQPLVNGGPTDVAYMVRRIVR
jgi:hypothetical protein